MNSITSPNHILKSSIPTVRMFLYCLICSAHPQPVYTSHSPFPDGPNEQMGIEAKAPNSWWYTKTTVTSSRCNTDPLSLGFALPHTYRILPFFLSPTEQELAAFGWRGLVAVTPPLVPSLLCEHISPLQPRKLERNLSAWETTAGAVPLWFVAPRALDEQFSWLSPSQAPHEWD